MNINRLLIGTLAGFVGYFVSSFIFYGFIFNETLAKSNPVMAATQLEPNFIKLAIAFLGAAFLLSYIFEKWAGIRNPINGAINGALIGGLVAFSYDFMGFATTNLLTLSGVFWDILVYSLSSAAGGAAVAMGLNYKRS
jgi:hypothetical protein